MVRFRPFNAGASCSGQRYTTSSKTSSPACGASAPASPRSASDRRHLEQLFNPSEATPFDTRKYPPARTPSDFGQYHQEADEPIPRQRRISSEHERPSIANRSAITDNEMTSLVEDMLSRRHSAHRLEVTVVPLGEGRRELCLGVEGLHDPYAQQRFFNTVTIGKLFLSLATFEPRTNG